MPSAPRTACAWWVDDSFEVRIGERQGRRYATQTLLVVDDPGNHLALCRMELEDEGYRVLTASDADGTILAATLEKPGLLVLDTHMRGMHAEGLLEEIKAVFPDLPVVIHTRHAGDAIAAQSRAADACVVKSSDLEPLKLAISNALRWKRKEDESRELVPVR